MLALSLIVMLDIPKLDSYQWLTMRKKVKIITPHQIYEGFTDKICEIGAEISLNSSVKIPTEGKIEFVPEGLLLEFKTIKNQDKNNTIKIIFSQVSLSEYRQLIKMIFCPPNRWNYQQTPRELMSFWLLIRALFTTPLQLLKTNLVK
jgi:cellulose synthase (UDP-forming)